MAYKKEEVQSKLHLSLFLQNNRIEGWISSSLRIRIQILTESDSSYKINVMIYIIHAQLEILLPMVIMFTRMVIFSRLSSFFG